MVEPQRSGWRSHLQSGALPALSSILTPFPSVELAPSQLLPSGGLEDHGLGARSLEAFCSAPLFSLAQFTVTRPPLGWVFIVRRVQLLLTHTLLGPHFQSSVCLQ